MKTQNSKTQNTKAQSTKTQSNRSQNNKSAALKSKNAAQSSNGSERSNGKFKFSSIESAVADFKKGKCVIVIDDEDRENEGDLIYSAEKSTPKLVNFLIKYTSGVICVPMEHERLKSLKLDMMTHHNTALHETAFTISVDYVHGT